MNDFVMGLTIPVSLFMALLLLHWMDISLNIMTLGAITVAIGRVIDDSIVVVENIYRRLHLKKELKSAPTPTKMNVIYRHLKIYGGL